MAEKGVDALFHGKLESPSDSLLKIHRFSLLKWRHQLEGEFFNEAMDQAAQSQGWRSHKVEYIIAFFQSEIILAMAGGKDEGAQGAGSRFALPGALEDRHPFSGIFS